MIKFRLPQANAEAKNALASNGHLRRSIVRRIVQPHLGLIALGLGLVSVAARGDIAVLAQTAEIHGGNRNLQGIHGGDRNLQGIHGGDRNLQGIHGGDRNLQGIHGGDRNLQGIHGGDRNLQGIHGGDRNLQGIHGGDRNLQGIHGGDRLLFDSIAMGPVESLAYSADVTELTVLGQTFRSRATLGGITVGDYVVVAGTTQELAVLSRINSPYVAGASPIAVRGSISEVDLSVAELAIGGLSLDYSRALTSSPDFRPNVGSVVQFVGLQPALGGVAILTNSNNVFGIHGGDRNLQGIHGGDRNLQGIHGGDRNLQGIHGGDRN